MTLRNPDFQKQVDLRQDRREWLKTSATLIGASVLPLPAESPDLAPQTQAAPKAPPPHTQETRSAARFFTPAQRTLVDELSETIIPADSHSGGAKAAKVVDFIEKTLRETQDEDQKRNWKEGLPLIDSMSRHYNGKSFVDASPEEKIAVLTVLSENERMTDLPEVKFFKNLKHLTVLGYYTSKVGIHDELEYKGNRVLQEYVGCGDQGAAET
jgi:hypothetical protein